MVKVSILVLLQKTESIKRNGFLVNFFRKTYPAAYLLGYQNTNAMHKHSSVPEENNS